MADVINLDGKIKRKRSANWDQREKNLLKSCITGFVSIVENKNNDTNTIQSKAAAWQRVLQRFNQLNNRVRTLPEIKQQWRAMKWDEKKKTFESKIILKCTNSEPKPPSLDPDTSETESTIPQEFKADTNGFESDGVGLRLQHKEFTEETSSYIREEHDLKMQNLMEMHRFATEEHNLKMQHMIEHQNLLKEETRLRMEKVKLEIKLLIQNQLDK